MNDFSTMQNLFKTINPSQINNIGNTENTNWDEENILLIDLWNKFKLN